MTASSPPQTTVLLPLDLLDLLNQTYTLHILATNPSTLLPPSKSLLSLLSTPKPSTNNVKETLQDRISAIVYRAFWDEALESLSSPSPQSQLTKLQSLYTDIHTSLIPLLPPSHPILSTLSSPISPSSPLFQTAITTLHQTLLALRTRCAPSRDSQIDSLLSNLSQPNLGHDHDLPKVIVETTKGILKLTEEMKSDLSSFILGSMSELQLQQVIIKEARERERGIISQLWGEERVVREWKEWVGKGEGEGKERFVKRLMKALGEGVPVSCPLPKPLDLSPSTSPSTEPSSPSTETSSPPRSSSPPSPTNTLPPPFLFTSPSLLSIQNYLQALTITASLRSLVRLPPTQPSSFVTRVWTLLKSEISESTDPSLKFPTQSQGGGESNPTKLVNLADEVVQAYRLSLPPTQVDEDRAQVKEREEQEGKLRTLVNLTVKTSSPIYTLLQTRLLSALSSSLLSPLPSVGVGKMSTGAGTTDKDKTFRPKVFVEGTDHLRPFEGDPREVGVVKGFEDPVLVDAIREVGEMIKRVEWWIQTCWGDLINHE
ncbi:hypothetical protein JAAARDRAFT_197353 [Jaapia argillacea MUCL 33604]|uniref:Uncharacterized protein n=1 Tax=Jaapia argillacea MUCL 33604 TaxID=933084 RepID=A0A067PI87_9AGAM|nr:hypothetical protein JAAARDRAFT_197353 [Jaapia argillacea MUCL 33604]